MFAFHVINQGGIRLIPFFDFESRTQPTSSIAIGFTSYPKKIKIANQGFKITGYKDTTYDAATATPYTLKVEKPETLQSINVQNKTKVTAFHLDAFPNFSHFNADGGETAITFFEFAKVPKLAQLILGSCALDGVIDLSNNPSLTDLRFHWHTVNKVIGGAPTLNVNMEGVQTVGNLDLSAFTGNAINCRYADTVTFPTDKTNFKYFRCADSNMAFDILDLNTLLPGILQFTLDDGGGSGNNHSINVLDLQTNPDITWLYVKGSKIKEIRLLNTLPKLKDLRLHDRNSFTSNHTATPLNFATLASKLPAIEYLSMYHLSMSYEEQKAFIDYLYTNSAFYTAPTKTLYIHGVDPGYPYPSLHVHSNDSIWEQITLDKINWLVTNAGWSIAFNWPVCEIRKIDATTAKLNFVNGRTPDLFGLKLEVVEVKGSTTVPLGIYNIVSKTTANEYVIDAVVTENTAYPICYAKVKPAV